MRVEDCFGPNVHRPRDMTHAQRPQCGRYYLKSRTLFKIAGTVDTQRMTRLNGQVVKGQSHTS